MIKLERIELGENMNLYWQLDDYKMKNERDVLKIVYIKKLYTK